LKCFRKSSAPRHKAQRIALAAAAALLPASFAVLLAARAELPKWMQFAVAGSDIENVLFRAMDAAGVKVMYPRPPAETRAELSNLLKRSPQKADWYALRARADEQALDFAAAEADWKQYATHASDPAGAKLALADYYHRRLRWREEIAALTEVAAAPAASDEQNSDVQEQRSWKAFERILRLKGDAELTDREVADIYQARVRRYPGAASAYGDEFSFLAGANRFDEARNVVAAYQQAFPSDSVFPVKATAHVEYRSGSAEKALAVYDHGFQPLWPDELIASYTELLKQTHTERQFLKDVRERLRKNPDDLNAAARIFWLYEQEGRLDAARQALADFRQSKDSRHAAWSAEEVDTLAQLSLRAQDPIEAARYYFALNIAPGSVRGEPAQQAALCGMIELLLTSPGQPIQFGAGNLAMYRDIATMDTGPGYFNGILSLFFNSATPEREAHDEEERAQPYFHRAKAAELLAILDQKFPAAPERAGLHAQLINAYANYGLSDAVIRDGNAYLAQFPMGADRYGVAMEVADAYARENRAQDEFGIYDRMLGELAVAAKGVPLETESQSRQAVHENTDDSEAENDSGNSPASSQSQDLSRGRALQAAPATATAQGAPSPASEYAQVLERYLARLTSRRQLPQALAVLRREVDRDPNDPGIYQRLAQFLDQNRFDQQEEEVYKRAMEKFPDKSWYDKLARFYLRQSKYMQYVALTRQVVDTFQGTDLETYFARVNRSTPQFYLQVNLYAHQRFPHDLVFVRNLLNAYNTRLAADQEKRSELLRQCWFESPDLEREFFEELSRTGRLKTETAQLEREVDARDAAHPADARDYAAMNELAKAAIWSSNFERSAPILGELASAYPAEQEIGEQASNVFRSLAYFDPQNTDRAVTVEKNLLLASPGDTERLAHIGDIYADRGRMSDAADFWQQMPGAHPGSPDGYLQAATVFWDYFRFDEALREIDAARAKFHQPALYGYEAGAIDENMGNPAAAVREYTLAALAGGSSDAHDRLLILAARPATRDAVDSATTQALAADSTSLAALNLRVDVLLAQHRGDELAALLDQAIARSGSPDLLDAIRQIADAHGLNAQSNAALEKQIARAGDPVHRMQLELALANAHEQQKQPAQALAIVDELYRQNPLILGAVRAEVDFNWRDGQRRRAVAALIDAAKAAAPNLATRFALEAADKASQIGETEQARELIVPLLAASPFDQQYVAAMAQTYSRAGDDAGLRDFYLAKIAELKSAPMDRDERKARLAELERSLIPALTRLKDYQGAMDQYIALLSAYPEDEGLQTETAAYALRYHREQQLVAFGNKTVADSPSDSRFAIILARAERAFHNDAAAIAAYNKAIAIRRDRSDLYNERVELEEQLQRYDDACADYERLYVLTYKDPQWILDEAKVRVRQGKVDLAVRALRTIWSDGRQERAADDFRIAKQLEEWGLVDPARQFAEQGVKLAGNDLLQPDDAWGVALYARIETRLRHQQQAYQTLVAVRDATEALSDTSPTIMAEQVEKRGLASVTDAEWRARTVANRKLAARSSFRAAVIEMGRSAGQYFTPEEKVEFAQFLSVGRASASPEQLAEIWIPAAHEAGLLDVEEQWRTELMRGGGAIAEHQVEPLIALETGRLRFDELGRTLEAYSGTLHGARRTNMLMRAANVYLQGGDETRALAVMEDIGADSQAMNALRDDYFKLLLKHAPERMEALAGASSNGASNAAANYLLANSDQAHNTAAIAARVQPAIWKTANTALVELYFGDKSDATNAAFAATVSNRTIGERVTQKFDSTSQLAGHTWFYYGMRYGVYRSFAGRGDEEDYIAAGLEDDPANLASYEALAQTYADAGERDKALNEYREALQLSPHTAGIYDAMAEIEWAGGNHDGAVADWRTALGILRRQVDVRAVPESFWTNFSTIAGHLGEKKLALTLKPEMDSVVRSYIAKNGSWETDSLLEAAFLSLGDPKLGIEWVIDLVMAAKDPSEVVAQLRNVAWIPDAQRQSIFEIEVALERRPLTDEDRKSGLTPDTRASELGEAQDDLINYFIQNKEYSQAKAVLDSMTPQARADRADELIQFEIEIAAHAGTLDEWLTSYEKKQDSQGYDANNYGYRDDLDMFSEVAQKVLEQSDSKSARTLLEYVLRRRQESGAARPGDYLALADADLAAADMPDALEQLRSLALSAELYSSLDSSASLLERTGHDAEALEFLAPLANGVPWEPEYKLRLARAELKARVKVTDAQAMLAQLAQDNSVAYSVRVEAATALNGAPVPVNSGSGELKLLASGVPVTPEQANRPYYLAARVSAARTAADAEPILLGALACGPSDEARLMLFEKEFALGHNAMALAAIDPLVNNSGNTYPVPRWAQNRVNDGETPAAETALPQIPRDERFKVASELAAIYEGYGNLPSAVSWIATAVSLGGDSNEARRLKGHKAALEARIAVDVENASRRPVIQAPLDQPNVVRPRIAASDHSKGAEQ
jgi:tetratricopeptide (TPR) repeat protein